MLKLYTVIFDGVEILPHFMRHYHKLGVSSYVIGVADEDGLVDRVRDMTEKYDVIVYPFKNSTTKDMKFTVVPQMLAKYPVDVYALFVDLDEFQVYPAPMQEILEECRSKDIWAVAGNFLDRTGEHGSLPPILPEPNIGMQFPLGARLTKVFTNGWWDQKVMLVNKHVKFKNFACHDTTVGKIDRWPIGERKDYVVHHFKYSTGAIARLIPRVTLHTGAYSNECKRVLAHLKRHGWCFDVKYEPFEFKRYGELVPL